MKITGLKTEYKTNPVGIDVLHPRMSWKLDSDHNRTMQVAYRIKTAGSVSELTSGKFLWDSEKIASDQSLHIEYQGPDLRSGQQVFWQVEVWDNHNHHELSEIAFFEMGLLSAAEWKASWVTPSIKEDVSSSTPCAFLLKQFNVNKPVALARVYVSALGLYEISLNGKKVGDELFTPGWTSYQKRIQYQVFDVTQLLHTGDNSAGAILGDGWYRGYLVWQGNKNTYGDQTALIFQLKITYQDGCEEWIATNDSWKSATGPILKSDIYNGETYDARLELNGWNVPGYDASHWKGVKTLAHPKGILVASCGSPVRITQTIPPIQKMITPKGELVFDLGQNMVGWIRFRLKGKKGEILTLDHAEVLDQEGNFYTENLRQAKCQDQYIFKGEGVETYEPRFTFHGFRYVRITGFTGEITLNDLEGRVVHSDMEPTGEFECSHPLINQLQKNIQWGLRGNFLDVPTDCPQRDERLAWTGDAQVFASTACFNMLTAPFYTKWMKDFIVDQKEDGSVPWVVPNVVKDGGGTGWSDGFGASGWGDAAVIIPWQVYQAYGDLTILKNQYDSMKGWTDYMIRHSEGRYIFNFGFHFGDWLSFAEYMSYRYNAPDYGYAGAHTDKDLIATAYFYYTTGLMEKIAMLLNKRDDAERFAAIRPKIKEAFEHEFVTKNGRLTSNTQTAYILALAFDIMPDEMRDNAARRLADDVTYFGHMTTGFLGTPLICEALADNGYAEVAYRLLFNERYPSWLYPVKLGATTIWERWDCIKPDGSFQTAGMNSFNHYAFGAVGKFLYSKVAGLCISEEKPGYKHFIIHPIPSRQLDYARATYQSLYGEIRSEWKWNNGSITYHVTIPANTTAEIHFPQENIEKISLNGISLKGSNDVLSIVSAKPNTIIHLGSGSYSFMDEDNMQITDPFPPIGFKSRPS